MARPVAASMHELLTWIGEAPRPYADVVERWGGWCPNNSPWEDARADGLVRIVGGKVSLSAAGEAFLRSA